MSNHRFFVAIAAASVAAVVMIASLAAVAQSSVPPTAREAVADPRSFEVLKLAARPEVCDDKPEQCGRRVLALLGASGPLRASVMRPFEETFVFDGDIVIYVYTVLGLADDSLEGERYRVAYRRAANGLAFVQAGVQRKCARDPARGWTKNACP